MCISLFIVLGQLLLQLRCVAVQPTLPTDNLLLSYILVMYSIRFCGLNKVKVELS